MDKKAKMERRNTIRCPYCNTPMVFMKKVIVKDEGVFSWYICPRRKSNNEQGCGHVAPIELVYDKAHEYTDPAIRGK